MVESAALLVDDILPELPIRPWVVTFPHALRFSVCDASRRHGAGTGHRLPDACRTSREPSRCFLQITPAAASLPSSNVSAVR